jgi:hypothetical protein
MYGLPAFLICLALVIYDLSLLDAVVETAEAVLG